MDVWCRGFWYLWRRTGTVLQRVVGTRKRMSGDGCPWAGTRYLAGGRDSSWMLGYILGVGWRWEAGGGRWGIDDRRDMAKKPKYVFWSPRLVMTRKVGTDEKIVVSARLSWSADNWRSWSCWRYTLQGVETASGVIASQGRGKAREAQVRRIKSTPSGLAGWLRHTAITFTITVDSRLKQEISLERMTFFTSVHKILYSFFSKRFQRTF